MKGCIALDIDGTITSDPYCIPQKVIDFLSFLAERGWVFLFVTGRTFSFAASTLKPISFPYFFAVQNGADFLKMPEKICLSREYLSAQFIAKLESLHDKEDFLVYAGWEKGDFCYYRPSHFSLKMLEHLKIVEAVSSEPWQKKESFSFSSHESFPLVKSLGTKEDMQALHQKLVKIPDLAATCIKDPLGKDVYLNLITASKATKGEILKKLKKETGLTFCIAAGDDYNDISLLKEANVAIAMKSGPSELLACADIIADSAQDLGIIQALLTATKEIL